MPDDQIVKKMNTPKGMERVRSPQYKLYNFIEEHFRGNVATAAKKIGMTRFQLHAIINDGIFGTRTVNKILEAFRPVDPEVSFESLFIAPTFRKLPEKPNLNLPKPILPRVGSVHSLGNGVFSRILERNS